MSNAGMLMARGFLEALVPPISSAARERLLRALEGAGQGLATLARLDADALRELGVESPLERASLLAAAADGAVMAPPPRVTPPGPVIVEVKIGFMHIEAISTVDQCYSCRFFLDLLWDDPRLVGATTVPDGTWFLKGVYLLNALGELTIHAYEKPILLDGKTGRVLWAQDVQGTFSNSMSLHDFPFDTDMLELYVHQAESASRDEYVLRPYGGGWNGYRRLSDGEAHERESRSVQTFFDVTAEIDEWHVSGFSIEAYEITGGNSIEYSEYHLFVHVARRWRYYAYKIVLPLTISTAFCMSAFLYDADDLSNRNGTSVTMFLATSALLYVVASVLPKTSYLTAIDVFVVQTLFVQFAIGVWSWLMYGLLRMRLDGPAQRLADLVAFLTLAAIYVGCVLAFFAHPFRSGLCTAAGMDRHLARLAHGLAGGGDGGARGGGGAHGRVARRGVHGDGAMVSHFHRFEKGRNVWPRKSPGELPPKLLKPHWVDLRA
mgnify:CR=1 FL=1